MSHLVAVYAASPNVLGALARRASKGARWNHCGVVVGDKVIEARVWFGVVATPLHEWVARYPEHEVKGIECPRPDLGEQFALDQLGKGYDYLGASGVPFRSHWQDPSRWYCSEKLEAALIRSGAVGRFPDHARNISPQESYDAK